MDSIRQDIELLRDKASECEQASRLATDAHYRYLNKKRANLYQELIAEAEENLRQQQTVRFRHPA